MQDEYFSSQVLLMSGPGTGYKRVLKHIEVFEKIIWLTIYCVESFKDVLYIVLCCGSPLFKAGSAKRKSGENPELTRSGIGERR